MRSDKDCERETYGEGIKKRNFVSSHSVLKDQYFLRSSPAWGLGKDTEI